jgi:hypothetical protein
MLTEAEKKWLEEREQWLCDNGDNGYFCRHCCHSNYEGHGYFICDSAPEDRIDEDLGFCPIHLWDLDDNRGAMLAFMDAAEFEARVAAWQADNLPSCDFCKWYEECFKTSCARTRLKHARLAVEAEIEKE